VITARELGDELRLGSRRPPRRRMDRRGTELAWLVVLAGVLELAAGTGLAYLAGFGAMWSALRHPDLPWLAAMAGALCVSFVGYYWAYRGIYRAEGGYALARRPLVAVVTAGYGGFFAHRGTTPDDLVLQQAGAGSRESIVRAQTLGGLEQAGLAVAGCVASIVALCLGLTVPSMAATLPWAVIPVPAAAIAWWVCERCGLRLRGRSGWRGRVCVLADSGRLAAQILARPVRYWTAPAGMLTFWAGEMFAVWAGLAVFGFRMNGAALVVGFATGMVFTRRSAPLAGGGILTVILALSIWYCGAPLAVAAAGIFAYRALTLWLPMPFAMAALPVLRQISKESLGTEEQAGPGPEPSYVPVSAVPVCDPA
jgi:hypothetical protein